MNGRVKAATSFISVNFGFHNPFGDFPFHREYVIFHHKSFELSILWHTQHFNDYFETNINISVYKYLINETEIIQL